MLSKTVMIGRMVKDPILSYTANRTAKCNFHVAVQRDFKNAQGTYDADYFMCVAWQSVGEFVANYLKQGQLVAMEGRMQTRSWVNEQQERVNVVELACERVYALAEAKNQTNQTKKTQKEEKEKQEAYDSYEDEDYIPET